MIRPDKADGVGFGFFFLYFCSKAHHLYGGLVGEHGDRAALDQAFDANAVKADLGQFQDVDLDAAVQHGNDSGLVSIQGVTA